MSLNQLLYKILFVLILNCHFLSCSSQKLRIETNPPEAEFSILSEDHSSKVVGITPLTISEETVPGLFKEPIQIKIKKKTFETENLLLPASTIPASGRLSIILKKNLEEVSCKDAPGNYNEIARGVAQIQNALVKKDLLRAELATQRLLSQFPSIGVLHDLAGNIFYLKKDFSRALMEYQKSEELQPGNTDTQRMIQKLRMLQNPSQNGNQNPFQNGTENSVQTEFSDQNGTFGEEQTP